MGNPKVVEGDMLRRISSHVFIFKLCFTISLSIGFFNFRHSIQFHKSHDKVQNIGTDFTPNHSIAQKEVSKHHMTLRRRKRQIPFVMTGNN